MEPIEEEKIDFSQVEEIVIDAQKNLKQHMIIIAREDDDLNLNLIDNKPTVEIDMGKKTVKKKYLDEQYIEADSNAKDNDTNVKKMKRTIYDDAID